MTKFMAGLLAGVMLAAGSVALSQAKPAAVAKAVVTVTKATIRVGTWQVTCMSDGTMKIDPDARP